MKLGICSDHAGYGYKTMMIPWLESLGYEMVDFGTDSEESVDYPDIAHPMAEAVAAGKEDSAIAVCGTGNGMSLTLNKHSGIRAGLAWEEEIARLVKAHNNANILVMPARFIDYEKAQKLVLTWLNTDFEGGRHQRRIDKVG